MSKRKSTADNASDDEISARSNRSRRVNEDVQADAEEEVDVPSEALALSLVGEQTSIPVPRVWRVVDVPSTCHKAIVMEFIPGRQLREVWPELSF